MDAALRQTTSLNFMGGLVSGKTFVAGVYTWMTNVYFASDIYLEGTATDVFIFQTTKDLIVGSGAKVILQGGALASNVVWQIAGYADVGTTAHLEGTMLVKTYAAFKTGSSINGRILSQTAVTLDSTTVDSTSVNPMLSPAAPPPLPASPPASPP